MGVLASVVRITSAPSALDEDGSMLKARCTDEHALQHAGRKVRTYRKAVLGLAGLLLLSPCGNLASAALTLLVFKESRSTDAIPQRDRWCYPTRRRPHPSAQAFLPPPSRTFPTPLLSRFPG